MIKVNRMQWNLYIIKWETGQFTVQICPDEPESINWIDVLDSEGDPDSAEVRRISPGTNHWIAFEEMGKEKNYYPHVLPEEFSLSDMFDTSDEIVWPD